MQWRTPTWPEDFTGRFEWHPWFAWYPVKVGNRLVWLEWIERRWPGWARSSSFAFADCGYQLREYRSRA